MKRFIITDAIDGCIMGTDNEEIARNFALNEDYFVADNQNGMWLTADLNYYPIEDLDE